MVTKTFQLDLNYDIKLKKFEGGKEIWLVDKVMKVEKFIGFLTENHKWKELSPDFFQIAKKHSSAFMNNIFKPIEDPHEASVNTKINCFKRRFNVKLNRTINKIKY